nr:hypothetical protein [Lactiplantibacillus plantarum]
MTENNAEIKKMEERIAKLDAQQKQLKAKKKSSSQSNQSAESESSHQTVNRERSHVGEVSG